MDKNKSIDGLASRSAKTARTVSAPKPKKPTAKPKTTPAPKKPTAPKKKPAVNAAADFLKPVQAFNFDEQSGTLTVSKKAIKKDKKSPAQKPAKTKKVKESKKPHGKAYKITVSIVITLLVILIGCGIAFIIWGNAIIANITGGQGNVFDLLTFVDDTYEPLKTDSKGRTNILAFGTSGYNMNGEVGRGKHDGSQLTDSIMVISLNQETGDVAMLSLPRDLKASPTCTATGKINEVYWCHNQRQDNEQAGAKALMAEVGNVLGLDFQYYVHINWGSLINIVDTLGGVTINLDEYVRGYYQTYEPGKNYTINGEQALDLARARHGTANGDFSRGASQQKILIGIKNKLYEKDLSVTELVSLANTLGDNLRSNFSVSELKTLAHLTSDFDFDSMRQVSLIEPTRYMTTGTINGISYVLPSAGLGNYTNIRKYVAKMFDNDPRTYEETSLLVLNGTDEAGLAANEQIALKDAGYKNVTADNAPEGEYPAKYTLYARDNHNPGTKRLLEKRYRVSVKPFSELPTDIKTNGYDFVLILGQK